MAFRRLLLASALRTATRLDHTGFVDLLARQADILDRRDVLAAWDIPLALATMAMNFSRLLFGVVPVGSRDLPKSSIVPAPSAAPIHANNAMMNQSIRTSP